MYKLTLNDIRAKSPCEDGWQKLLKSMNKATADNTEVKIGYIAKSNSVDDALWVLFNCVEGCQKEKVYLMHDIAARVLPIYEAKYPDDTRVRDCLQAIKDFADGKIDIKQLDAAADAARAARAARAADAAADAARAAGAAAGAARAARAADAARAARAADAAAGAAEQQAQIDLIIKYFGK